MRGNARCARAFWEQIEIYWDAARPAAAEEGIWRRMPQDRKPPGDKAEIDQPVQAHLGEQLKRYFSSIVSEPVPDRFSNLLNELEKRERASLRDKRDDGARQQDAERGR